MVHFAFVDRSFDELTAPSIVDDIAVRMCKYNMRAGVIFIIMCINLLIEDRL